MILLTAKDTDSDCYTGITLGSDDYITKPFKPMLLSAKIHALLRRVQLENDGITRSNENDFSCGNPLHMASARLHRKQHGSYAYADRTEIYYFFNGSFRRSGQPRYASG